MINILFVVKKKTVIAPPPVYSFISEHSFVGVFFLFPGLNSECEKMAVLVNIFG